MATAVELDEDLKSRIQHLADLRQQTPKHLIQEAIRDYVSRAETKERFRQEALASWESYQETRQHLTAQEVRDWLMTWGDKEESELPSCHD